MEFHPVADLFPLIDGPDFDQLCEDIKAHGLLETIKTWQEKIVDGRNRYRACLKVGVKPRFEEWDGKGSLVEYVWSLNLHRRHLTASQRAVAIAKGLEMLEEEARQRQEASRAKPGEKVGEKVRSPMKPGEKGKAAQKAAKIAHVSSRTVEQAKKVVAKGSKATVQAVEKGKVSVSRAARIADLSPEEQFKAIQKEEKRILANGRKQDLASRLTTAVNAVRRAVKKWEALKRTVTDKKAFAGGVQVLRHLGNALAAAEKVSL